MNPTERFSTRVEDYVRYRPTSYPAAVFEALARDAGWLPRQTIADVGAGTGIFTQLLLERGNTVYAVEPNDFMRAAAEEPLGPHPRFHPTPGTAEATALPEASVDGITVAQAFHWFDRKKTRAATRPPEARTDRRGDAPYFRREPAGRPCALRLPLGHLCWTPCLRVTPIPTGPVKPADPDRVP